MKKITKLALVVLGFGVAGSAAAAVPAGVTTALSDAATDAGTVGSAALVAIIAAAAFKYIRRAV